MEALADRFSGDAAADLKTFLDEQQIAHDTWSRVGS